MKTEEGRAPPRAPAKCMVEGAETYRCQGKGSDLGSRQRRQHRTRVPSNPAIGHLTVQPAEARPQETPQCPLRHSAAPPSRTKAQELGTGALAKVFSVPKHRGSDFLWRGREALYTPRLLLLVSDLLSGQGDGLKR